MAQNLICNCGTSNCDYLQIITWIVIIIGWFIVNSQHNKRELRKERRAQIDTFNEKIDQLEKKAVSYHTHAEHNELLARDIKRNFDEIRKFSLRIKLLDIKVVNRLIINLRRSITFKNFDNGINHKQESENGELVAGIYNACDTFIESMEASFHDKYN